jgi:frataxin-like iron-binding protein CyaY
MKDLDFAIEVERIINKIATTIEDNDQECRFDLDLNDGILSFSNESGTYIINKQSISKEIWTVSFCSTRRAMEISYGSRIISSIIA